MHTVLDIDLDFFVTKIKHDCEASINRLSEEDGYLPVNMSLVKSFLEQNCGLSQEHKIPGNCFEQHDEVFDYWRDLIDRGFLNPPFQVVHVDAHSDLGFSFVDNSWTYITTDYLDLDSAARQYPKRGSQGLNPGNFLIFTAACGWLERLTLVLHPEWENDLRGFYMKGFGIDGDLLELKQFDKRILKSHTSLDPKEIPYRTDCQVPLSKVQMSDYRAMSDLDLLCNTHSPSYTPESADEIFELIKSYIDPYP